MVVCEASADAVNQVPGEVLDELRARLGDFLLIGAHARDFIVHGLAGLPLTRLTRDLDIAIAVPDLRDYHQLTAGLHRVGDTGMAFLLSGCHVDVIPFGLVALGDGLVIETNAGILTDTTGLSEAFQTANLAVIAGRQVKVPTLHAMLVLKTIAWSMRGSSTTKDATDLAMLFDAASSGHFADRCWADLDLLAQFDADPTRVGLFLAGLETVHDLPASTDRCMEIWLSDGPSLCYAMGEDRHGLRRAQLAALVAGTQANKRTRPPRV